MTYRLAEGDDKGKVRAKLVDDLAAAIKQCLGDTENDQIHRNSRIYGILSELWLFGTEIDEWYGIVNLPEVIQNHLTAAQALPDLMRRNSFSDAVLGRGYYINDCLESAATLTLNEENWPKIKGYISSAMSTISLITHFHKFKIDQNYHDDLVRRATEIPAELDEHLERLQKEEFHRFDLEKLSHELRTMAFKSLVPQHPLFADGLKEVSLDLRRNVLRWAKNPPKMGDAISAVRDIRERLGQLIDKYISP